VAPLHGLVLVDATSRSQAAAQHDDGAGQGAGKAKAQSYPGREERDVHGGRGSNA